MQRKRFGNARLAFLIFLFKLNLFLRTFVLLPCKVSPRSCENKGGHFFRTGGMKARFIFSGCPAMFLLRPSEDLFWQLPQVKNLQGDSLPFAWKCKTREEF